MSQAMNKEWIPVLRKKKFMQDRQREMDKQVTLYVEGIPEAVNPKGLFNLFTKYDIISDVFILNKKNKVGKRFGFVRYGCSVSAEMAILRVNGIWMGKGAMLVKVDKYSTALAAK
ncbi:hypothetical protein Dimus_026751 [Dionaea muscipula]